MSAGGRNAMLESLVHDVLAAPVLLSPLLIERLQGAERALGLLRRSCPACEALHWTQIPDRNVLRGDFWWCPTHDPKKSR